MQYETPDELPKKIRRELPGEAQELYVAVYRRTWEECHMGDNGPGNDLAETAHDAAMLAVQSKFENRDGQRRAAPIATGTDADKLGDHNHEPDNGHEPKQKMKP